MSDEATAAALRLLPDGAGVTLGALQRGLRAALAQAGLDTPDLDARTLLGHVCGLDLTGLVRESGRPASAAESAAVLALARRRLGGEPVARLTGMRGFWGLEFQLSAATLEPRPDTETVIEVALAWADRTGRRHAPLTIADLGTGSGAIVVALLGELGQATGIGIDIAADALATARANAERLGVGARAHFCRASFADALAAERFDLIASNPPYIESGDLAGLSVEVRAHDPRLALDGGADGLDAYRALAGESLRALKPGGALILEIGWRQAPAVSRLLAAAGFVGIGVATDIAGRDRVVSALKP